MKAVLLFTAAAAALKTKCAPKFDLKRLANQEQELNFCTEHAGRTCCGERDTLEIRKSLSLARYFADPPISSQCFTATSQAFCSVCDADVGTGINSDGTLCPELCVRWWTACQDDFFDPYVNPKEALPFCKEDSVVCSKVSTVVTEPEQFCEFLGFKKGEAP